MQAIQKKHPAHGLLVVFRIPNPAVPNIYTNLDMANEQRQH